MQPINPNTLFNIFEQGDEQVYREHGVEEHLKNPYVLMGMVVRGIENYHLMDIMYLRQYPEQYKKVRNITKYKYYNKLYSYLTKIDSDSFDPIHTVGESFEYEDTLRGLNHLRIYYERIEEYEKCAILKKYIDLLLNTQYKVALVKEKSYI